MPSVGLISLGCKVNTYETEYLTSILKEKGYEIKDFNDKCDIYIINTCTVTNTSDTKSGKTIRRAKKNNPHAIIVAMGCFIESHKENNSFEGIDIVVGTKDKAKVPELIEKFMKKKTQIINLYKDVPSDFEDMYIEDFPGRTRAFVKIQDGCENFCSYCIIPFVRGKCCSKEKDKVLEEINALVNNGYQEIVLTGIHTGNYGADLDISFADLLKEIVKIKGLKRLRISSIECTEINDEILELLKTEKVIVDHLHIPIQSGTDEILKLMNRKYDIDYFINKIEEIRSIRPDIAISTDIIVGFPGETEELFQETLNNSRKIGFSKIHVFPYSIRNNTPAAKFKNQVDGNIKKDRVKRLISLSEELEEEYMKKFIGKKLDVLIERYEDGYSIGHTSNFLLVKINKEYKQEDIVETEIIKVEYPYVIGK